MQPRVDVAVFGATGFVGRLVAAYLAEHAPPEVQVGLAGRSRPRLEAVRAGLGSRAKRWPLLVADSQDRDSLERLATATRVVATTVGPYHLHGLELVGACAQAGTAYADLTGEVLFIRDSIDRYDDVAKQNGARIVHSCGFDSIPSDLGVMLLSQAAHAGGAGDLEATTLVVKRLRGGVSGGTLASGRLQMQEIRNDARLRRIVGDPYALSPDRKKEPRLGAQRELRGVEYDKDLGIWLGPFVMAGVNTRVVRRSNALQGWAYGRRFRYREVIGFGSDATAPLKAAAVSGGLAAFVLAASFPPANALLERFLPKPGEGPNPELRRSGLFRIDIHTKTSSGAGFIAHMNAEGDPGYAATAVMLGESALCLALDSDRLPERAGVLTPATAMGNALVDRLRAAGQTLDTQRVT